MNNTLIPLTLWPPLTLTRPSTYLVWLASWFHFYKYTVYNFVLRSIIFSFALWRDYLLRKEAFSVIGQWPCVPKYYIAWPSPCFISGPGFFPSLSLSLSRTQDAKRGKKAQAYCALFDRSAQLNSWSPWQTLQEVINGAKDGSVWSDPGMVICWWGERGLRIISWGSEFFQASSCRRTRGKSSPEIMAFVMTFTVIIHFTGMVLCLRIVQLSWTVSCWQTSSLE